MKLKNITLTILFLITNSLLFAQTYTFNTKVTFRAKDFAEGTGVREAYFYLNTQNGNCGLDAIAWQRLVPESAENTESQVDFTAIEYGKQMISFVRVQGKKYAQIQTLGRDGPNETSNTFWKNFRKTGKRQTFGKYTAQEYVGNVEGKAVSFWLDEKPYTLNTTLKGDVAGFAGIGYIYNPNERRYYLIVHAKVSEGEVTLLDITPTNFRFDGSSYPRMQMPSMGGMGSNMGQNPKPSPNSPTNPNTSQPSQQGQFGNTGGYKCANIYEQSIMVIEQSLPAAREMLKNNEIPAEQKNEMRKVVTCMERKLPILKQALTEAKAIDGRFGSNFDKLSEECGKLQDKYQEKIDKVCE